MNRTKVESSETEDQIIETSEGLRDYLQACARQALRSVIRQQMSDSKWGSSPRFHDFHQITLRIPARNQTS